MLKLFLKLIKKTLTIFFDAAKDSQFSFQTPATEIMDNIIDLHHDIFSIMIVIATIIFYIISVTIWKFRSNNYKTPRNFSYNHQTVLEIIWTIIPVIILILILIPSFVLLYGMDEVRDVKCTLKVTGHQWYWVYEVPIFKYSWENLDKIITAEAYMLPINNLPIGAFRLLDTDNIVYIPTDVNIRVLVTAADVLHSWAIPSFGIKIDACPGRLNQIWMNIYRQSVFYGQCSEICGINHGFMPIVIKSQVSTAAFTPQKAEAQNKLKKLLS